MTRRRIVVGFGGAAALLAACSSPVVAPLPTAAPVVRAAPAASGAPDAREVFSVAEPDAIYASYRCEGGRLASAVYTQDRARVVTGPDTFDLPVAISASGARYALGDVVWWVKGDGAFLEKAGVRLLNDCVRVPAAG